MADFEINREPFEDSAGIPPYTFVGPFCYSLRCVLCRNEVPHTTEQHLILSTGFEPNYPHACKCGCAIRFGDPIRG